MPAPLLQLSGLSLSFGPTRALDDVSFDLQAGEVHLLAGENGAGKSTLIKILAGIYPDHAGTIRIDGREVRFATPQAARRAGIAVIHQELSLVDPLSVEDNLQLGREASRLGGWWLDRRARADRTRELCRELDLEFSAADLARPAGEYSLSVRNRLEIARALGAEARIIVMDEPTSALHRSEVDRLFRLIDGLRARGVGVIYISHKLEEIYRIADRITVLRDGRKVATAPRAECPPATLIRWMIGRELVQQFPARPAPVPEGPVALEVRHLRVAAEDPARPPLVQDLSFAVRAGEIVGLAGLQGSGAAEVLHALFGARGKLAGGEVALADGPYEPTEPAGAIARGLVLATADRKATGLVLSLSVEANITLAALPRFSPGGVRRPQQEQAVAAARVAELQIRLASTAQEAGALSGGNQQKVALARWLETRPRVLLLEEPTRGIDVGAKQEIYALLNRWTSAGAAILMISTEMPELLALSDRILVLHRGGIAAEFGRAEASAEKVLAAAMGAAPAAEEPPAP